MEKPGTDPIPELPSEPVGQQKPLTKQHVFTDSGESCDPEPVRKGEQPPSGDVLELLEEATQQETPNPPPSQPEQANGRSDIIDQAKQIPVDDKWRKDKYGQILSPAALYSRFYRSARSPSPS